jgi:hypothetical protein
MSNSYARIWRAVPTWLGVITLVSIGALLACAVAPRLFPVEAHDLFAALSLVLIALAHIAYQTVRRASPMEWAKAILLVLAFLFWAANQLLQDRRMATLFNDAAIAAFVLDAFLVIVGWPGPAEKTPTATHEPSGPVGIPSRQPLEGATNERA